LVQQCVTLFVTVSMTLHLLESIDALHAIVAAP